MQIYEILFQHKFQGFHNGFIANSFFPLIGAFLSSCRVEVLALLPGATRKMRELSLPLKLSSFLIWEKDSKSMFKSKFLELETFGKVVETV